MESEILKILLDAYVRLNKLHAEPGGKCHMLASSLDFVKRQIATVMKQSLTRQKGEGHG